MDVHSYVAMGDSFTEGLDDLTPDGRVRGWADRVAERLALDHPGFEYANLAVRGKVLDQIVADQVPVAERLRPDLITFCAGGNDIIGFACDTDDLAARFDAALGRLVATGAEVLIFTGFDLRRMHPFIRRLRGRIAVYNESMRASAERHGCRCRRPLGDGRAGRPAGLGRRPPAPDAGRARARRAAGAGVPRRAGARRLARPRGRTTSPRRGCTARPRTCGGCATTSCRTSAGGCWARTPTTATCRSGPSSCRSDPAPAPAPPYATNGTFEQCHCSKVPVVRGGSVQRYRTGVKSRAPMCSGRRAGA